MRKASTGFAFTAVVWLLVIGLGTAGSLFFYKPWILQERKINKGQMESLETEFKRQWMKALDECSDTPSVDVYTAKLLENKKAHQLIVPLLYKARLQDSLKKIDEANAKKHTRIKLAYDSFSGYCVFRSKEFQDQLAQKEVRVHLVNDEGEDMYKNRIEKLNSGDVPLAVFTVDALINNSALFDKAPASIVMVIDESRGADAMVAYKEALPSLQALDRKDIKIVATLDSPSETLARLVRYNSNFKDLPRECFVEGVENAQDVYRRFKKANPSDPTAYVLWEPFVSQLLQENPKAIKLIDTKDDKCKGYIMDVLVVQNTFLKANPDKVEGVVKAYLSALAMHRKVPNGMLKLIQADSKRLADDNKLPKELTEQEAENIEKGIHWHGTSENYALFGLEPSKAGDPQPLTEMVPKITTVLNKTGAISRKTPPAIIEKSVCETLKKSNFDETKEGSTTTPPVPTETDWSKLAPLTSIKVEPIEFKRTQFDVTTDDEELLKNVVGQMKKKASFLEIKGLAVGKSEIDEKQAKQRATSVYDWLKDKGGVEEKRLKVTTKLDTNERKVEFHFFEAPE
jgi:hypothetical protein